MKILLFFLFANLAPFEAYAEESEIHPVYNTLKTYRTYYIIKKLGPISENFDVYFFDNRQHCIQLSIYPEKLISLTPWDLQTDSKNICQPPRNLLPIPLKLKPTENKIKNFIAKMFPHAKKISVNYQGRFGQVTVQELIPTSVSLLGHKRMATESIFKFKYNTENALLDLSGVSLYSSDGIEIPWHDTSLMPIFLDYQVPFRYEGKSLFRSSYFNSSLLISNQLSREWELFKNVLLSAIRRISQNSYKNPYDELLAKQGERLLPKGFHQNIRFTANIVGKGLSKSQYFKKSIEFEFSAQNAWRMQPLKHWDNELQILIEGEVSLEKKQLRVSLTDSGGTQHIKQVSLNGLILEEEGSVAIASVLYLGKLGLYQPSVFLNHIVRTPESSGYSYADFNLSPIYAQMEFFPIKCEFFLVK